MNRTLAQDLRDDGQVKARYGLATLPTRPEAIRRLNEAGVTAQKAQG